MGVVALITIFVVGEFSNRFQFGIPESRDSLLQVSDLIFQNAVQQILSNRRRRKKSNCTILSNFKQLYLQTVCWRISIIYEHIIFTTLTGMDTGSRTPNNAF